MVVTNLRIIRSGGEGFVEMIVRAVCCLGEWIRGEKDRGRAFLGGREAWYIYGRQARMPRNLQAKHGLKKSRAQGGQGDATRASAGLGFMHALYTKKRDPSHVPCVAASADAPTRRSPDLLDECRWPRGRSSSSECG